MTTHLKAVIIVLCCILLSSLCIAEVRLPQLISNLMVLQRDTKLKIWSWASPGEKITTKFAGNFMCQMEVIYYPTDSQWA
jgi:sialate O-acetylesterase